MNKEDVDFLISIQDLDQPDFDNACLERENNKLNKEIDRLNNDIKILLKENEAKEKVIKKQDYVINELEKHICQEWYCFDNESVEFQISKDILNKLKELKGENND